MKQFVYFLLSFVILFSACKKDEDITDPDESQKDPVEDVTPGDSVQTDVEEKVVPALTSFVFEASNNAQYLIKDIECTIKDSMITALIPYVTEIDELVPSFDGVYDKVSIGNTVQRSGLTTNDYSKEVVYTVSTKDTTVHYTVTVFCFTGLPIVNVETDNRQEITSKEDYVYGNMTISKTAEYSSGYQGRMRIRGRGNATFLSYPKKPYKVKLDEKASILDMPSDKEWVLLANYCDKSLLRTSVAFKLSEMLDMYWTPRTEFVELFLNGRYMGNYLMGEHVKVSKDRLNVTDDGYLIERDGYYQQEPLYFMTQRGNPFTFKHPDTDDITQEQIDYIHNYMDEFETALYSDNFADPSTGYRKYINAESWVNWYLTNEILCNKDCNYYFFKYDNTENSKLGMSPVWDFEWSLGIGWNYTEPARVDVLVQRGLYFDRLMQDPYFAGLVKDRWNEIKGQIPELINYINVMAQKIEVSQQFNFKKWDILNTPVSVEVITLGDWANEVQYIKDFLVKRVEWLSSEIPNW